MKPKNRNNLKKPKKSLRSMNIAGIFSHRLSLVILSLVLVCFIVVGTSWAYAKVYEEKIYPGVKIGALDIGGLTADQAKSALNDFVNNLLSQGFKLIYEDTEYTLATNQDGRELIIFNIDETIGQALEVGREQSLWDNIQNLSKAKTFGLTLPAISQVDETSLNNLMRTQFSKYDSPARDAAIVISFVNSEPVLSVTAEQSGYALDYAGALAEIERQLLFLDKDDIDLMMFDDEPEVSAKQANEKLGNIKNILDLAPIKIAYTTNIEKLSWNIGAEDFSDWLALENNQNNIEISFSREKIEQGLDFIAQKIEIQPHDAKFTMEGGRVTEFVGSRDGVEVDWDQTFIDLKKNILQNKESEVEIMVKTSPPQTSLEDLNDLGIKELIGVGRSDFSGSPVNRRHNIKVGSTALNGLLIEPDEEFSTIGKLTPVTAANGYLPELVIKENKTIPEYGGGLCQIGTTMFRVALSAGVPITERNPHSYRVVYYEPAGKDAAVYEMHPDVRFINDTGSHILIQTHIQGDDLIFEFWGTHDGREVYQSDSRIFNITSPPALKEVETLDLEPGERKCTEGAHPGADAEFDYKVTYPDGRVMEETFSSHYRAWGAVCLIGVDELSNPPEADEEEPGEETEESEPPEGTPVEE